MKKRNSNESSSRWKDKNIVINTSQRHYEYHIETTIKTSPMVRKEKQVYIFQHPRTWEGTNFLHNLFSHLAIRPSISFLANWLYHRMLCGRHHTNVPYFFPSSFYPCRAFGGGGRLSFWTIIVTDNLSIINVHCGFECQTRDYNKLLNSTYIFHVLTFWHIENFGIQIGEEYSKRKPLSTSGNPFLQSQNWQKSNQRKYWLLRAIFLIFDQSQTLYWARKFKNTRIIGRSRNKY